MTTQPFVIPEDLFIKDPKYKLMFITVTYAYIPFKSLKRQYLNTVQSLITQSAMVGNCIISPEFTLNNTIHYHLVLELVDKYRYHRYYKPWLRSLGFNKTVEIRNFDKCMAYILKDIEVNSLILDIKLPLCIKHSKFEPSGAKR